MSTVEDRIASVLDGHVSDGYDYCSCGQRYSWAEGAPGWNVEWAAHAAAAVVAELQPELGELEAIKLLLAATREQLSRTVADFCAVRDAVPRQQVEQILADAEEKES